MAEEKDAVVTEESEEPKVKHFGEKAGAKRERGALAKTVEALIDSRIGGPIESAYENVFKPMGQDMLYKVLDSIIRGVIFDGRPSYRSESQSGFDRGRGTDYTQYGSRSRTYETKGTVYGRPKTCPDTDIRFRTKSDAVETLEQLKKDLRVQGVVRVADLYEYSGISVGPEDYNYGWRSLTNASIYNDGIDSWILRMPRPESL